MASTFSGRVWKFGDDINTDLIIPGYALFMPPEEQRRQCFSANRPGWVDEVQAGDVLIAGQNFGVGSARAIGDIFRGFGMAGIVAESFNGLGLRNCVNVGNAGAPLRRCHRPFRRGRRGSCGLALRASSKTRPRERASKACQCIRLSGTSSKPGASRTCSAGRDTSLRRNRC